MCPPTSTDTVGALPSKKAPHRSAETTSRAHFGGILPPVIGHRGAAGCAPENTLAGLRKANEIKCRWVEFDVRLTADGQLILLHDERLERTTNGRGEAALLPLKTVQRYDAGCRFGAAFRGERVPTLAEAVALLSELGIGANVELKAARDREAETGAIATALLCRLWPPHLPALLISSVSQKALAAAQACAPRIARGMLFRAVPKNWRVLAERFGCATIHADHRRLHPSLVAEIRESGYPLLAYTVNDPRRADTLFGWGVTSVFSDVPHILFAAAESATGLPAAAELNLAGASRQGAAR
jgi:glycerophosphoryl diester phosphodiesterase